MPQISTTLAKNSRQYQCIEIFYKLPPAIEVELSSSGIGWSIFLLKKICYGIEDFREDT